MGRSIRKFLPGIIEADIGALIAFIPGGQGIGVFLMEAGLATVGGIGAQSLLAKQQRMAISGRDLGQNLSDSISGLPILFGQTRTGFLRTYAATLQSGKHLWLIGALGHGPITSVNGVYLDDTLAIDSNGRAKNNGTTATDFTAYAHAWWAHGTDGQFGVVPRQRGALSVTNSVFVDGGSRKLTIPGHTYQVGDAIGGTAGSLPVGLDAITPYPVKAVSGNDVTVATPSDTRGSGSGSGGSVDHFTPNFKNLFSRGTAYGRGIAWMALWLNFSTDRFPNGVPRITVDVTASGAYDPRSPYAKTITAVASGPALGYLTATLDLTITAHGFVEGDIVQIAGTGLSPLDGIQRIDRVVDANTVRIGVQSTTGTFSGSATATRLGGNSNPIIALRQLLTSPTYGVGAAASEIDDTKVASEANYCDTTVAVPVADTATFVNGFTIASSAPSGGSTIVTCTDTTGLPATGTIYIAGCDIAALNGSWSYTAASGASFTIPVASVGSATTGTAQQQQTQPMFVINGALDGNATIKQNIESLLQCCRGALAYQGGVYAPFIRRAVSAAMTLDENTIVGDWRFTTPGQRDMVNVVRATFVNPSAGYQADQIDWPAPGIANQFLADDQNQLNRADVELPLVDNKYRAEQIAMVLRRESRVALAVDVTCRESAYYLTVGDRVDVSHAIPGWTGKSFWVTAVQPAAGGLVRLSLVGYDATAYALDAQDTTPFAPALGVVTLLDVQPPTSLVATAYPDRRTLTVSWTASTSGGVVGYQVQYKPTTQTDWALYGAGLPVGGDQTQVDLPDLQVGASYDIRVRAVHISGQLSAWATLSNQTLSARPGAPSMLSSFDASRVLTVILGPTDPAPTGVGFRVVASTSAMPADATVDAATFQAYSGTPVSVNLGSFSSGATVYIKAFAYTASSGGVRSLATTQTVTAMTGKSPPSASPTITGQSRSSYTVSLVGALGEGAVGPLQWRYRVITSTVGSWTSYSSSALPQTVTVTRDVFYATRIELQVLQEDGQTIVGSCTAQGALNPMDTGSGAILRDVPMFDGAYALRATTTDGKTADQTIKPSGGSRTLADAAAALSEHAHGGQNEVENGSFEAAATDPSDTLAAGWYLYLAQPNATPWTASLDTTLANVFVGSKSFKLSFGSGITIPANTTYVEYYGQRRTVRVSAGQQWRLSARFAAAATVTPPAGISRRAFVWLRVFFSDSTYSDLYGAWITTTTSGFQQISTVVTIPSPPSGQVITYAQVFFQSAVQNTTGGALAVGVGNPWDVWFDGVELVRVSTLDDEVSDGATGDGMYKKSPTYQGGEIVVDNANFETPTTAADPLPGYWASSATISADTTSPYSGTQSAKVVTGVQFGAAASKRRWRVRPGERYRVSAALKSGGAYAVEAQLQFRDAAGGYLSGVNATTTSTTWLSLVGVVGAVPANAAYAQLVLQVDGASGGTGWFDDVRVDRIRDGAEVQRGGGNTTTVDVIVGQLDDAGNGLAGFGVISASTARPVARGVEVFDAADGVQVTFSPVFSGAPLVITQRQGKALASPNPSGTWTGGAYNAATNTYLDLRAYNITASSCYVRARFIQYGTLTTVNVEFTSPLSVTTAGSSTGSATISSTSNTDQYTCRCRLNVSCDTTGHANLGSVRATIILESNDGTTGWQERYRDTKTESNDIGGVTSTNYDYEVTVSVSGMGTGDTFRWTLVTISELGDAVGGTNSNATLTANNGSNNNGKHGVTYITTPGDVYQSLTPASGDAVHGIAMDIS